MYVASLIAVFVVGGAGYKLLNPSSSAPLETKGELKSVTPPAPAETVAMDGPEGSNFDAPAVEEPKKRRRRRRTTPSPVAPVASDAFVTHTFPRFTIDAPERFSESSQVRATWMRYALKTEDGIEVQIDRSPRGSGPLDQLSAPTGFDKTWSKKADYQRFRLDNDTFQDRPSVVFEFERKQDDRMVHKKITYFATDEHTWAIVLMTPLARWDASKEELERIEATFRAL
ncbi:hypothetical protein EON79_15720 [bacterium]|nr:MAG: hypothetical protein EON79_15720 [bacterium]